MLTDEEIMDIRNRAKLNDNRQIDPMAFARQIERAVLEKVMPIPKREPAQNNRQLVICDNCFDDWADEPERMGQVKTNDCGEGCCYIFNDCKSCNGLGYKIVLPAQAESMPTQQQILSVAKMVMPAAYLAEENYKICSFAYALLSASPDP